MNPSQPRLARRPAGHAARSGIGSGRPRLRTAQRSALALLLAGACLHAQAANEGETAPLRLSGFATLGLTHNDNADAGAISSFSQLRPVRQGWSANLDSVLGLQLEWQPLASSSVLLQAVSRAGEDGRPQLRAAYLRQQLGQGLALRLGRLRSPLYFDSDIAEIGYANLAVRPALPLYSVVNSVASLDGGDLQWRHNIGDASLLLQAFAGGYAYQHRFNNLQPVQSADARLSGMRGFSVAWNRPELSLRFARTEIDRYTMRSAHVEQLNGGLAQLGGALQQLAANPQLPPQLQAALQAQATALPGLANPFDNRPIYTSLGLDANLERWRLMGELTHMNSRAALVGRYRGASVTLARSFDDFTPYLSYARLQRYGEQLDLAALSPSGLDPRLDGGIAQLRGGFEQAQRFADLSTRSISVGLRWDWRENMALKAQFDRINTPSATTPGSLAVGQLPFNNKVQLFSLTLDLVF
ncbi:hypothetical protein RQP53_10835 [Paucibacter sp. APW11]|uniref:TIGR03016 family PEP-CTERM system-associated outer membrane protein n=1 Tax=Roseateles aquae TaxID=3077235 RepID=A0ABU3PB58_9BURK|nr:hypothetical protein [Paucibacter sp. APW11]MDT8999763.1 hypothetical protein [Paucibacter sp. APW11]